ncbi:MAG: WD40 repeat domain-containing protein [Promethearchaeota archaeon]
MYIVGSDYGLSSSINRILIIDDKIYLSADNLIKIYSKRNFKNIGGLIGHDSEVLGMAVDGKRIYSCTYKGKGYIWDINKLECIDILDICKNKSRGVQFDENFIYFGAYDDEIKVYDRNNLSYKYSLKGHFAPLEDILKDGIFMYSYASDQTVRVWNLKEKELIKTINIWHNPITINFDEEYLYVCSYKDFILIYDKKEYNLVYSEPLRKETTDKDGDINKFKTKYNRAIISDENFLYIASYEYINILKKNDWRVVRTINFKEEYNTGITAMELDDKFIYVGARGGMFMIFDKKFNLIKTIGGSSQQALSIKCDNKFIYTGNSGGSLRVFDMEQYKDVVELEIHEDDIYAIAIDDEYIYTGSFDGRIAILDKNTLEEIFKKKAHSDYIYCIDVDEDYIYTCSRDQRICKWNKKNLQKTKSIKLDDSVWSLAVDSLYIYAGTSGGVLLVLTKKLKLIKIIDAHGILPSFSEHSLILTARVHAIALDDQYFYSGGDDGILSVCKKSNLKVEKSLQCFSIIRAIDVDESRIYSAMENGKIRIWSKKNLVCIKELENVAFGVPSSLYVDSKYIYIGSFSRRVFVLDKNSFRIHRIFINANNVDYSILRTKCIIYNLKSIQSFGTSILVEFNEKDPDCLSILKKIKEGKIISAVVNENGFRYSKRERNKAKLLYEKYSFDEGNNEI